MKRSRCASTGPLLAMLIAMLAGRPASAETTAGRIALNTFEPTPTGDAFLGVPSPRIGGHLELRTSALFDYASKPITMSNGELALVSTQAFVHANVSLPLYHRWLFSANLPLLITQSGEDPGLAGAEVPALSAPTLGDLRVGARVRLWGFDDYAPFQAGVGANAFVPTGASGQYVGEGDFRIETQLLLGGRMQTRWPLLWSASAGAMFRLSQNPHTIRMSAGLAVLLLNERLSLGAQALSTRPMGATIVIDSPWTDVEAPAAFGLEVLGEARYRFAQGAVLAASGGPGPLSGLGTPAYRLLLSVGWSPPASHKTELVVMGGSSTKDTDGDGVRDDADACPTEKGGLSGDPSRDGCPPPDHDRDGVLDFNDACPVVAGEPNENLAKNGCPRDSDDDGIPDAEDACPQLKGLAESKGCPSDIDGDHIFDIVDACPDRKGIEAPDPTQSGCPEDADGDGIPYPADYCPRERGFADAPEKGCPRFVKIKENELVLSKRIELSASFTGKGFTVKPTSAQLLQEVRDMIADHPDIQRVEVQGHTDDSGDVQKKLVSSQQEAEAVVAKLVELGVPAAKLSAKGYGHKKPIADNRKPGGPKANHRIAIVILEKSP